jgi:hypothetical protein
VAVGELQLSTFRESNNSRAQSSRVRPIENKTSSLKHTAHNLALHADSFPVNDAHDSEAFRVSFAQVFLNDCFHLSRRNRVQIEDVSDFDHDRLGKWVVVFFGHAFWSAPARRRFVILLSALDEHNESGVKPPHSKARFAFARRRSIIFLAIASYQIPAEFADLG